MILRLTLLLIALGALPASRAAVPNFIFILADDLGWTSLSQPMDDRVPGARSDYHETPSLERLARGGMRFTQGDEKLVKLWKTGALELYDLSTDLGERTDLTAQRPERVRELHEQLMSYLRRVDAEVLHGYGKGKKED